MNVLVIATCDVKPEEWEDFTKAAAIPPPFNQPEKPPLAPYVLVHCRDQDLQAGPMTKLSSTCETKFPNATWADIRDFMRSIPNSHFKTLHSQFFMIFDDKSATERKITIISQMPEWVDKEGNEIEGGPAGMDPAEITKLIAWRRFRVPFDKTWDFWSLLDAKPGDESDEYLEGVEKETASA
ncbi:hypothetical protein M011DRAFT_527118 [Sporormia fimetaria CBS 119925]|uniref:Uncharacterized protein n=1 Tax=Sporormia fimetaria CBS 119925 TaxID=1340428 RepID=A0A6A6V9X4_9PLEO|nr:hypothetical protein M011DRAFT_527118 [Sporormia fimetaria CBS 119925]